MARKTDMTVKLSLMAIVAYGVLSVLTLTGDLQNATEVRDDLADEAKNLSDEISQLHYYIENSDSEEFSEEFARDELYMANYGEIILCYK